ncbi:fatty acid desaturase family protein [Brevibacterium litoralis]|uniref:fatty acid desaturase family protein n=1 Tax=Brevibacterium litoralis TaxID=3138935 RepID=UPI0032F07504
MSVHSSIAPPMTTGTKPTRKRESGTAASEFTALAKEVRDAGLLRRRYGYYWTKFAGLLAALGATVAVFVYLGDTWWQLITAVVFTVVLAQIAFLGHDAAHRQIFRSGKWNDWASLVLANLFVGMSYGWWQSKHTRHHANPNKLGRDPDIELPVLSVTEEAAEARVGRIPRWISGNQGLLFFPLLLLEGLELHVSAFRRVFSKEPVKRRVWEISFLLVRHAVLLGLVFWVLSPGIAFAFLGVHLGLFGLYLGMSFAPNHKGMPMIPRDAKLDFMHRQVLTSRNIRGGRFVDTAMGGLNYQIEHHLFPSMPRPHLREAARMISEYCRKHDVPYTETGLVESYVIIVKYLNRVGLGERDIWTCPLVAQQRYITS